MKITTKYLYAAFAAVALATGAVTADGALNDLFASINGNGQNGGGFIYQFTPIGVQSTFASGLSWPRGVAFDKAGNLFVATNIVNGSTSEGSVVKITPDGVQSTFVTFLGNYFLSGLTLDQSGNVFVIALGPPDQLVTIYKITPDGVPSTFATPPSIQSFGLAFDSAGNLYTGVNFESEPAQIWKYAPDGTSIVFATASSPDFDLSDLAFDRFGTLFVSVAMVEAFSRTSVVRSGVQRKKFSFPHSL
jgi:hypothetical protein